MNINDYRKQYREFEERATKAKQDFEMFKVAEHRDFYELYRKEQEKHLLWIAEHIDYLQKHKEYIKNSPSLSKIVIDFLPLYTGGGLVSGAGFCLCSKYKIYLGDLIDVWDAGFCYKGYPIVSCNIGIHWNTDYTIKYIKNKKIKEIKVSVKGQFRHLPGVPSEVFGKVRKANIADQFHDMSTYKNIDLLIKVCK